MQNNFVKMLQYYVKMAATLMPMHYISCLERNLENAYCCNMQYCMMH